MSTFLLYHQAARHSAPRLASYMGITAQMTYDRDERPDFLIRYGTARAVSRRPAERTINRRSRLIRYSTRLGQYNLLQRAGVNIPPHCTTRDSIPDALPAVPHGLFARDFTEGRQQMAGRGLTHYGVGDAIGNHDLYTPCIDRSAQYRVHVCMGRTRTRQLIPTEAEAADQPIWNLNAGFTFRVPIDGDNLNPAIPNAGVAAVTALGLDFGAVDILVPSQAVRNTYGSAVVLEVNTAPGLSDASLEWYARHLGWAVGLTTADMPGWDAAQRQDEEA